MRAFAAVLILGLLALPAAAQQATTGVPKLQNEGPQKSAPKPKVDDKAYGNALGNLPDKAYDPWKGVR
jgi:hypothetical protein